MASIKAYASQFYSANNHEPVTYIATEQFLQFVENSCIDFGKRIGVKYGEGLLKTSAIGLNNLNSIILPDMA